MHFCCITLAAAPGALAHKQGSHHIQWLNPTFPSWDNIQNMYTGHLNSSKQLWEGFPKSLFSATLLEALVLYQGATCLQISSLMVQSTQNFCAQFPGCLFILTCCFVAVLKVFYPVVAQFPSCHTSYFYSSKVGECLPFSFYLYHLLIFLTFPFLCPKFRSRISHYISCCSVTENRILSS